MRGKFDFSYLSLMEVGSIEREGRQVNTVRVFVIVYLKPSTLSKNLPKSNAPKLESEA